MHFRHVTSLGILRATALVASAANIPVVPKKLVVVDKIVAAGKAKVAFVVKDPAVTKGAGEDPEQISVQVDLAYGSASAAGAFVVPAGTASGWVVNKATVAKYVNKSAPAGPTEAKVAVIKPAKLLKLVGKGLGDTPFDVLAAGDPAGPVLTAYCVDNAGEENCHCSSFTGCVWKSIGGGTGAKLVCKTGTGDAACSALVSPTTTTSTTTSTSTSTSTTSLPCGFVDLGLSVLDTCTNLEWEKKTTAPGSGVDAGNPTDVDNEYSWAGVCSADFNVRCQPNLAASTTCTTHTGGAVGCSVCGPGQGTCDVDFFLDGALTTVWDWLNQLNAATFAGVADWRLSTSAGPGFAPTGDPAELESIVDVTQGVCGGGSGACIDPVFGPTIDGPYWSGSTETGATQNAAYVWFNSGSVSTIGKAHVRWIRAVRDATAATTTTTTSTSTTTSTAPIVCCEPSFGGVCLWVTAAECTDPLGFNGTVGAPGSVCDGVSGNCVAPPASPGECYEGSVGTCYGGPSASLCLAFGGCTSFPGTVCTPSGCQ